MQARSLGTTIFHLAALGDNGEVLLKRLPRMAGAAHLAARILVLWPTYQLGVER
jgi:hypothetical protein